MILEKTSDTPSINLSVEKCIFEISGNSFSDKLNDIYAKVVEWIDIEMPKIECSIKCKFNFYVYNSVTYKNILLMMSKFYELKEKGKDISIVWYYDEDDEDSLAIGKDINDLFDITVEFEKN